MKVKKYTGSSLDKIRQVILKELGENAVIINIKKGSGKGGLLGVGKSSVHEVIAAVEDSVNADNVSIEKLGGGSAVFGELLDAQKEQYIGLRNSIKRLGDKLADVDDRVENISLRTSAKCDGSGPPELENIHDTWTQLLTDALKDAAKNDPPSPEDWHEALASILPTAGGIMFRRTPSSAPDAYVLAGPTGVGKTTTLAKLAAKCVLGEKLNVGLITTDTFRVAAVDQLREYSSLLGVEIAVAFSPEELQQQLKFFHDKDVVFIDTPGRSQFDETGINAIRENLKNIAGLCVLLVVPASVRREDAETIVEHYGALKPSALIISKTDEASRCDGITRLLDVSGLPVLYLADGQRVPEDLHVASPGILASMIMPFVKSNEPIKIGDFSNA